MTDLVRELDALRSGPAFVDRSDRGFVRVTGPDAQSFLQVIVSADLDALADGDAVASLLLHPQGKLDVAFRVVKVQADDLWLDTDPGMAPQLVTSLERFKIRVDATIEDRSASWGMLTVLGVDAAPDRDDSCRVVPSAIGAGVDVVGPADVLGALAERLSADGVTRVGPATWEAFRVERGMPVQPFDIDDDTIPQEAELELDAVSFTKGCFVGQELVCRIDSRGHVNRFLRRLAVVDGDAPAVGAEIVAGDKVVGAVTSVTPAGVPPRALGYVRREIEPGATVELRSAAGSAHAQVEPLRP